MQGPAVGQVRKFFQKGAVLGGRVLTPERAKAVHFLHQRPRGEVVLRFGPAHDGVAQRRSVGSRKHKHPRRGHGLHLLGGGQLVLIAIQIHHEMVFLQKTLRDFGAVLVEVAHPKNALDDEADFAGYPAGFRKIRAGRVKPFHRFAANQRQLLGREMAELQQEVFWRRVAHDVTKVAA